jgi:RimJ/RimL family protein N-acetyltransferase
MIDSRLSLPGHHVTLAPLTSNHHAAFCAIGLDPELWRWTTIQMQTPDEMREYIEAALAARDAGSAIPFAIVSRDTGEVVGTTRLHSFNIEHRRVEIGFTWVGRQWQGTAVNPESKYLLLQYAFSELGCLRVQFKTDHENEPSRRALLKIGATEEGVLRRFMLSRHRGSRDVRIFSILASEWPHVKGILAERLNTPSPGSESPCNVPSV